MLILEQRLDAIAVLLECVREEFTRTAEQYKECRDRALISQDEYEKCVSAIDYARVDATVAYERLRQAYNKLADWCE